MSTLGTWTNGTLTVSNGYTNGGLSVLTVSATNLSHAWLDYSNSVATPNHAWNYTPWSNLAANTVLARLTYYEANGSTSDGAIYAFVTNTASNYNPIIFSNIPGNGIQVGIVYVWSGCTYPLALSAASNVSLCLNPWVSNYLQ